MKEYALIFRMDVLNEASRPDAEQMELYMLQWSEWINEIANAGRLSEGGNHFSFQGRVLMKGDKVINTPYSAEGVSVAGYILILANDMDDATLIARKCPILNGDKTSVEIRETASPG